jgi:hypothetical protein
LPSLDRRFLLVLLSRHRLFLGLFLRGHPRTGIVAKSGSKERKGRSQW